MKPEKFWGDLYSGGFASLTLIQFSYSLGSFNSKNFIVGFEPINYPKYADASRTQLLSHDISVTSKQKFTPEYKAP